MNLKYELQNIISGISKNPEGDLIKAAAYYLGKSETASRESQQDEFSKNKEETQLIFWIEASGLWFNQIDPKRFIAQGAEQRVYLDEDVKYVIKLNDTIFYASWIDYLHNLLIHNFLFPETAYALIGFHIDRDILYAVVKQPFIEATETTDSLIIKEFLLANGFKLKKNNDYFHPDIGIILEDLHDENVLINDKGIFFIDTIFYLMPSFFENHSGEIIK